MVRSSPLIGVTSYVERTAWTVWRDLEAAFVPAAYVQHIQRAGGTVVVVPPLSEPVDQHAAAVLSSLDGLVLVGGVDVEPRRYGQRPGPTVQEPRPDRDASELALARHAVETDLPLLGICRGMQVMAVASGGSLIQHLPDVLGSSAHAPAPATYGRTAVRTEPTSRLAGLLGEEVEVPCYHHQGVATYVGYEPVAWAADGTLEAIEAPSARWRFGVQWHPERGTDPRLFETLVGAARG